MATNTPAKRGRPPKPKEVEADTAMEAGEQIAKAKRPGNNKQLNFGQENVKPGDNAKYTAFSWALVNMDRVDLTNEQEVYERVNYFFQVCVDSDMKPAVAGLAAALGIDRRRLWEIANDNEKSPKCTPATSDLIKKAYKSMELLWENYMLNGKINPVSGIFLGKNNFSYSDSQEYVIRPGSAMGAESDPTQMAQKYQKALPGATIETEGAESE